MGDPREHDRTESVLMAVLYGLAIASTAVALWAQVREDPLFAADVARLRTWWQARTERCAGCRRRKEAVNRMLWEARQIVTGASPAQEEEA